MKIEIPSDCEKIHVLFSGGADSTLLLYYLLREIQRNPDIQVACYGLNMQSSGIVYDRCKKILNVLEKEFNSQIFFRTFNKKFILRNFVELLLSVEPGYVFSGCNKVLDFLKPSNYIPGDTPPFRGEPFNEFHIRPFIDMDKSEIISYYIKYDIVNLLNMTYSCGFNLKTPCKNCYFCLEREWALKMCELNVE